MGTAICLSALKYSQHWDICLQLVIRGFAPELHRKYAQQNLFAYTVTSYILVSSFGYFKLAKRL